jgi:hypothetical protein
LAGVAIGNLIDITSSLIAGFLASFAIALYYALNQRQPIDASVLRESGMFLAASSILGSFCSILAGYISARIAKHDQILNGALSSVLCVGVTAYSILSGNATHSLAFNVAFLPLSVALSASGGYMRFRQLN